MALELGDLTVQSTLGQPLRASIAYALAPNEMLSDLCVSVGGGQSTSGLPGIGPNTVRITDSAILIRGQALVREPMLGTRVTINCPYTPNLSREYMLFVDPVGITDAQATSVSEPAAAAATAAPVAATPARQSPRSTRTAPVNNTPIGQSTRHQVQVGETLSDIASRIQNRSMKLWPAVNLIFETNPDAFIDNDPNKLKAGSWLTIPSMDGSVPVVANAAVTTTPVVDAPAVDAPTAEAVPVAPQATTIDGSVYEPPILEDIGAADTEQAAVSNDSSAPQPGDIVAVGSASENPFVEPATTIVIPDTALEGPVTSSESPNVPTAIIRTGERSESTSTFAWLIGGGLAILALLVLFGRRIRNRFTGAPVGAIAATSAGFEQDLSDYDIEDDSPTEENLALDADLILGTGLEEGTDMDIAQDFGFATSSGEVDIELPFEPEASAAEDTDIIPPTTSSMDSILESEILPEDDDYDMSVIMDATKMPQPDEVTERDLQAIEVTSNELEPLADDYTINKDVEYDILEQDYLDELTATQALNKEIARAAGQLAEDLDEESQEDATSEMPRATVTELDVTAQLPVQDEDDTIETAKPVNPNDTAAVTINMTSDEKTAEMPVANDDETAEMEISGGKSG
jgi:hypothetical protein